MQRFEPDFSYARDTCSNRLKMWQSTTVLGTGMNTAPRILPWFAKDGGRVERADCVGRLLSLQEQPRELGGPPHCASPREVPESQPGMFRRRLLLNSNRRSSRRVANPIFKLSTFPTRARWNLRLRRWLRSGAALDVLINNARHRSEHAAGEMEQRRPESVMPTETWDSVIGVNLKGVFLVTRAIVPRMIKGGGGVILPPLFRRGPSGKLWPNQLCGVQGWCHRHDPHLGAEVGKYKIRVNAVAPGFITTDMVRAMPAKVLEAMVARTPIGRAGTPEDVANTYFWLASLIRQASFGGCWCPWMAAS